jgi:hypothetical protein
MWGETRTEILLAQSRLRGNLDIGALKGKEDREQSLSRTDVRRVAKGRRLIANKLAKLHATRGALREAAGGKGDL